MSRKALIVALALALAACAGTPEPAPPTVASAPGPTYLGPAPAPVTAGPAAAPVTAGTAPTPARSSPTAAGWAVSIIGTPFAIGFKAVICAASVVVAAPVAGFLAFGDPSGEGYEALGNGLAQNCGPPYVVSPYAAS